MTLAAWFARMVGVRIAAALLALAAVLQLTDLFEIAPRLLDQGRGAGGLGVYALLRSPDLLLQAAPLAVLGGALFGFGRLARDNAVTALRAAGVSGYRLALLALPAAVTVAGAMLVLTTWVAPRCDTALAAWLARGEPAPAAAPRRSFRLGDDLVTASPGDAAGRRLAAVDVCAREADGRLARHLVARDAVQGGDGRWRLRNVTWEAYGRAGPDGRGGDVARGNAAELVWTDKLAPADVRALWRPNAPTTPPAARRALRGGAAALPLSAYRIQLARLWSAPAGVLVVLLIAAPTALGQARDGGITRLMLAGLGGGLGFLVADGVFGALGSAGMAPALLAAWAAPVLFAAAAVSALLHLEG